MGLSNISAPTGYAVLPRGFSNVHYEQLTEPDTSNLIENVLSPEIAGAMYNSDKLAQWMRDNQIELLDYGAGEKGISVRMLADLPEKVIEGIEYIDLAGRARKISKTRAAETRKQLVYAYNLEPK